MNILQLINITFQKYQTFGDFKSKLDLNINNLNDLAKNISNSFNGISVSFVQSIFQNLQINTINDATLLQIYTYIKNIIHHTDSLDLNFNTISDNSGNIKDYYLIIEQNDNPFSLNFFIDDFYYKKETSEEFKTYRNTLLKFILDTLKKYNKRLLNINEKLKESENLDTYRLYGELITANLYKIKNENVDNITLENYYDNNKPISISLDKKYTPSINAKRFFKKYNKLKNTLEIVSIQKKETIEELNYIESIIYELENCSTVEEVSQIYEEISENIIFKENSNRYNQKKNHKIKKSKLTKNKMVSFNPLKYTIDGYTVLVGRNNKENDILTLKHAKKSDIWFHAKDFQGSHTILLLQNSTPPSQDILIKCAQIAAFHSKARNSTNIPVDYCEVKYVKKPRWC